VYRHLAITILAIACHHTVAAPPSEHQTAPPLATSAPELCCCEWTNPNEATEKQHYEARASACTGGTPAMPEGACVDWSSCGFASGAHRTIADRPDLASTVAVPAGACCCDSGDAFRVVEQGRCTGTCLDADWCAGSDRTRPQSAPTIVWIDRCVEIADHFEPWRKNPDWAREVSPRARLIADCQAKKWSSALQQCLLAAAGPLQLDDCVNIDP
jgi:hypothetical protein